MNAYRTLAASCVLLAGSASAGWSQPTLEPAIRLYEAAAYEEALVALDAHRTESSSTDRVTIDHYRVLCLLALGQTSDAESTIRDLIALHPTYELDADTSPRVRTLFDDVRRRVLPDIVRARYRDAKGFYDTKRFGEAATGFAVVATIAATGGPPDALEVTLRDLVEAAAGLRLLALAADDAAHPPPLPTLPATPTIAIPTPLAGAAPSSVAPSPSAVGSASVLTGDAPTASARGPVAAEAEYAVGSLGVVPPVAVSQQVDGWRRGVPRPRAGTPLGTLEVVIDESGAVVGARMVGSVSAFYDAVLLESARAWRYHPATKDGRPVRFRRLISMAASGG